MTEPGGRGVSLDRGTRAEKTFATRLIEWADPDSLPGGAASPAREAAERALAAALRAVAGRPGLAVDFAGAEARAGADRCTLPVLSTEPSPDELAAARGAADALAAALRHHAPATHLRHAPQGGARTAFDLLEQCRCEALIARALPGAAVNLSAASADRLRRQGVDPGGPAGQIAPVDALRQVIRSAFGIPVDAVLGAAALASWRSWLEGRIGERLAALAGRLDDQERFARLAAEAALLLGPGLPAPSVGPEAPTAEMRPDPAADLVRKVPEADASRGSAAPPAPPEAYRRYTQRYDEVVDAASLCPADELAVLRRALDAELGAQRDAMRRLANRLQRALLARQRRGWAFDLEEGLLDAAKLDRVVTRPELPLAFKQETEAPFRDTAVTLLIDNSGSMRGRPIAMAAMAADLIARALELCAVPTEILGFTTAAWHGGRSARDWARAGRPAAPGRITDLRHIVYKPADQPWRRAHRALGAMLLPGLLKENVDGEALLWAAGRLLARRESRRILMVISDGAPQDAATAGANGPFYLEAHLKHAIAEVEASAIELCAIGIRHDVGRHYRRAVTIPGTEQLAATLVRELGALFAAP